MADRYLSTLPGMQPTGSSEYEFPGTSHPQPGSTPFYQQSKKSAPPPPDYTGAAEKQASAQQANINQQTQANRPDINTPFASQQWSQGPDGQWHMQTGFSGPMGGIVNGLQGQVQANMAKGFGTGDDARNQAIQGAYGQATSRLDPQWNQRQEQIGAQLANQGLDPNSEAYRNAMGDFSRSRNDAYSSAMANAIAQGTAAQQATFGENMAAYQLPFQQLQGAQSFLNTPGFNSAGVAPAPNYFGAAEALGNYNLGKTQQDNAFWGDIASGAGTLGAAGIGGLISKSDERLKQNIQRLPVEAAPGVPLATFEYKAMPGRPYVGVIAQDLERTHPEHVAEGPDGFKRVSPHFAAKPFTFK